MGIQLKQFGPKGTCSITCNDPPKYDGARYLKSESPISLRVGNHFFNMLLNPGGHGSLGRAISIIINRPTDRPHLCVGDC